MSLPQSFIHTGAFIRTGLLHVPKVDAGTGEAVSRMLISALQGVVIQQESYAASDARWLEDTLCKWCDEDELDLLLTIGGTLPAPGPSGLEIVPEATLAVSERLVPGLAEVMRANVREQFPGASLHRGVAAIRGSTLILNLPGGATAAPLFLEQVLEDLPYILAHLRVGGNGVTLEEILHEAEGVEVAQEPIEAPKKQDESQPAKRSGKGLNAEEFAAFLKRGKQGEV